jgi:hypothetical protein
LEINEDSGHVPERTELLVPPVPPPPVGSERDPISPGETIDVSPPPLQDISIKAVKM